MSTRSPRPAGSENNLQRMAWREPPNTVQVSIKRLSASGRRKRLAGEGQVLGMVHLRARTCFTGVLEYDGLALECADGEHCCTSV